jgi:hypothetical protein
VLCLVRRCAMDRPAVSRGAHLRAATAARCYSMRRMRGGGGGQVGRANNLLKEARQSACSESEPGRVDHYMEGSKPGQGRRFSMDAARSGARSRIRPAPLRRISYPSEGVPGSHANGRSSTGRRQLQPVFSSAERLAGWSPTSSSHLGAGSTRRRPRLPQRHALRLAGVIVSVGVGRLLSAYKAGFLLGRFPCPSRRLVPMPGQSLWLPVACSLSPTSVSSWSWTPATS